MKLIELRNQINRLIKKYPCLKEARVMLQELNGTYTDVYKCTESGGIRRMSGHAEYEFIIYSDCYDNEQKYYNDADEDIKDRKKSFKETINWNKGE